MLARSSDQEKTWFFKEKQQVFSSPRMTREGKRDGLRARIILKKPQKNLIKMEKSHHQSINSKEIKTQKNIP